MQTLEKQLLPSLGYQQRITLQPLIRVFFQEEAFLYLARKQDSLHSIATQSGKRLQAHPRQRQDPPFHEHLRGRVHEIGGKDAAMGRCINQGLGLEIQFSNINCKARMRGKDI